MQMSTFTFDETFEAVVAISAILILSSAAWIICILINIEKTKEIAFSTVLEDDGTGTASDGTGTGNDLKFEESTDNKYNQQLEVEQPPADGNTTADAGITRSSPTRSGRGERGIVTSTSTSTSSSPSTAKRRRRKNRRVSGLFVGIQCLSVGVLILLTYLLLVIGEELRRQRVDRIMLLLSLFLVIASMLSSLVYSMKSLSQGEIYEGPARIVGYDMEQYNNSQHDPTTRADIAVSWGKNWGCPLSGGKVCQSHIQGAMCQTHPEKEQTKHKPDYEEDDEDYDENDDEFGGRLLKDEAETKEEEQAEEVEEELEEDLEDEEDSNEDLEEDNESLEEENEELKEEIEELKEENEIDEQEEDELVDEENTELDEIVDEYDEDIMIVEEEEYDEAEEYEDAIYEMDEENLEEKIESTDDDATIEELDEEIDEDVEEIDELDEEYEEDEDYFDEVADEFEEDSEDEYEEFTEEEEVVDEDLEQKEEIKEEIEETEAGIDNTDKKVNHKDNPSKEEEAGDDVYEEMADEVYEEEEEEIEEEFEEEEYDEWYWDENPDSYDDDIYEDEYWSTYDWDSVWGEQSCEDLFDSDVGSKTYDINKPAGADDEWPFVNIYGSCKTCEAYVLDYFAEEAFEEVEEYKQQAIVYLAGAMAGFIWATLSYVKYRVMPTAENEIELLGGDGGVMA
ncbi:hypothetical protein FRACYDRAFT_235703 [Fragilariopsis cylindrus CCMP1102]|uniref:Uncharacterized protein n=1 Tax=Fragilariopsis cylindrus CCMP1102 TaxID=635003 RepID=A0A1E7FND6_9STRA|nr:hypothetical protein FRACYDRAFT_235703 [Fragilariopsis cylindrus CCMP1102]|eukprot:OEU19646.1 hypothetical protein FRACYDRAFT_235703 [Fragilariopsis cylindrus CCMP1102]